MNSGPLLPLVCCAMLAVLPCAAAVNDWAQTKLIAHALGGIDHRTYTNSKEALELNYAQGHRVFEVDFAITLDGVMVARHDWSAEHAELLELDITPPGKIPSLAEFRSCKIYRTYTPITLAELAEFLTQHQDAWLITDTKSTEPDAAKADFDLLVRTVRSIDDKVLSRIVPQIYNQEMLSIVRGAYDFHEIIYTLYQSTDSDAAVVEFCVRHNLKTVTMGPQRYTPAFRQLLEQAHLRVYVHTINSQTEAEALFSSGVSGVYTDFLRPSDIPSLVQPSR